jgi:hypothetical protein
VKFNTAWDPPIPWLQKVSEKFPLTLFILAYSSEEVSKSGVSSFFGGSMVEQKTEKGLIAQPFKSIQICNQFHDAMNGEDADEDGKSEHGEKEEDDESDHKEQDDQAEPKRQKQSEDNK